MHPVFRLASNPSTTARSPLDLARTANCGESFEHVRTLYDGHGGYPTMAQVGEDLITTFTRDGKSVGIGAVAVPLPPPMHWKKKKKEEEKRGKVPGTSFKNNNL